jgi:DNA-binding beta-propeller fold protein YncE
VGTATARFTAPYGITTDGTSLFITDISTCKIRKLNLGTGIVTTLAGSSTSGTSDGFGSQAQFNFPLGITTDGTNLYVTDVANCTIRKVIIDTGEVTTLAGNPGHWGTTDGPLTDARFNYPVGITIDGNNLFIADQYSHTIRKLSIDTGIVSTLTGKPGIFGSDDGRLLDSTFFYPFGITYAQDNHSLFVTDWANNAIRMIIQ